MAAVFPTLWVGPAGSGKIRAARAALGAADATPHLRSLEIGDYSARYWEFPTHMEIDIMDLSMMDKQILPEMLNQLLGSRDVCSSSQKIMILRRIHGLSPPAATRLRACLEELVWSYKAPAIIWATARTVSSSVMAIMDGFVYRRVPGPLERTDFQAITSTITQNHIPTIQTYIATMMQQMVTALNAGPPALAAATWIRGRVYDLLGLMIVGADLVSGLTWATVRMAAAGTLDTPRAIAVLEVLTRARWVPSYRTPLMLELIIASVYNALAKTETT